jgi:chromosome segregation ATPase
MVGCGPSDEQRRQAVLWQQQQQQARQRLEKCRRDQTQIKGLLAAMEQHQGQLRQLQSARYQSAPQPQPPDPALAARFSREDRELDELRYRERMRTWQMAEQRAYGHWLEAQASQREQLRRESQTLTAQLRRLNPGLFKLGSGDQIDPQAVQLASRCQPADFGLAAKAKGDQVGK